MGMKKALSLLLVLALCVSLSACCCNVPGFVEQFIPGEGALKNDNGFLDSGAIGNGGLFGGDEGQQSDGSNTATLPVETQKIKYMPGCTNRNVDTVGPELVSLGLKVDIEYVYDNTVGEGYIISQSIHEGAEITQGQVVTLTVSKGPDVCPYEYSQKLLITAPYGSSYGTATLYEWGSGDWQMITSYSVTLGRNGIGGKAHHRACPVQDRADGSVGRCRCTGVVHGSGGAFGTGGILCIAGAGQRHGVLQLCFPLCTGGNGGSDGAGRG